MQKLKAFFLILAGALFLQGCASVRPAVSTICSVCRGVCPLVGALTPGETALVCPSPRYELVVMNWKAVEKTGAKPELACKEKEN